MNAANNLMKALKVQNETTFLIEVETFLDSVGGSGIVAKYKDTFLDNGIEDLETILELTDKHLEQMSVPLGHKLKMLKRIKDLRSERGLYVPPSRQGTREKP
jgi:SAM domain (Sterile alpha motif)